LNTLRCGILFWFLWSAAMAAQAPDLCAGDDCDGRRAQLSSAAAQLEQSKNQFVSAVRQLIQTIARVDGDDTATPSASAEDLARVLARWDQVLRTYRTVVLESAASSADAHVALAAAYLERGKATEALKHATTAGRLDLDRSDPYVLQGLAYDLEKRPTDAAKSLAKAAKLNPGNPSAVYGLAQRLIAIGDEAGAADALRRFEAAQSAARGDGTASQMRAAPFVRVGLLRQSPDSPVLFAPSAYVNAFSLLSDGSLDQAVVEFRAVAASHDLNVELRDDVDVRQGLEAFRRGDLQSAVARLEQAIERLPGRAGARKLLGLVYQAAERYDQSIEQLSAAIALSPADDLTRQTLAEVLVLAKRPGDAERVLLAAIDATPKAGGSHYQLARLYQSLGRNGDAIRELERAAVFPPVIGQDRLYDLLGVLYSGDANLDGALAAYRRRVLANPNVSDAHRKLGQIYLEQSRGAEAAAEFSAALLLDSENAEAYAGRAQLHVRLGEYEQAAKSARRALMLSPQHAAAQYALGSSLVRLGQVDEGTRVLEEFRRLQAATQAAADQEWELRLIKQSAQAKIDAGDFAAAIPLLQQIAGRRPDVPANHVNLGLVLEHEREYAAAIDAYHLALTLDPEANVHGRLAAAYAAIGRTQDSQSEQRLDDQARANRIRARGDTR
jgi:tetratricopeptide (TPR) repeat protein